METYAFELNGTPVTITAPPKTSLLECLRENLGITSTKGGCAPQGLCGCCTVLINNQPRLACTLSIKTVAGKSVTTLEGIDDAHKQPLAQALCATGGTQCGYCTPGIVLTSHALLERNPTPSFPDIQKALNQHLCRCTGYTSILEAIDLAARARRNEAELPPITRPEGREIVLGERIFVDDLTRKGALNATLIFANSPTWPARLESIQAPENLAYYLPLLQPGDEITHPGIPVAILGAPTSFALAEASQTLHIQTTPLPHAPQVLARIRRSPSETPVPTTQVTTTLEIPFTDPVYLEPEACLAIPTPEGITLYTAAQDCESVQKAVPNAHIILVPSGGSYGGKIGGVLESAAARLALHTNRPVRLGLSMEEGMRLHGKRPRASITVTAGINAENQLCLLNINAEFWGGLAVADADRVLAQAMAAAPYEIPGLSIQASLSTSTEPVWTAGTLRGAGNMAVVCAVEHALDRLCLEAGVDGLALRRGALPAPGVAVISALEAAWAVEAGTRGLGVSRSDGIGGARVWLKVESPWNIEVFSSVPDLGQGRNERLRAVLVAVTGMDGEFFSFPWGESDLLTGGTSEPGAGVEEAASEAGRQLASAGALHRLVGRVFVGEEKSRPPESWTAALAVGSGTGIERLYVATSGDGQDRLARNLAEGAAHMGVGAALSEEIVCLGAGAEGRLRMLGVQKPKGSPELVSVQVPAGTGFSDPCESAVAAGAGATVAMLAQSNTIKIPFFPPKRR